MTTPTAADLFVTIASSTANVLNSSWDLILGFLAVVLVVWAGGAIIKGFTGAFRKL